MTDVLMSESNLIHGACETHQLEAPPQHSCLEVLRILERATFDALRSTDDTQCAKEPATGDVVVQTLQVQYDNMSNAEWK